MHTFRTDGTERRRVAFELQEQIAQTLGAVKFKVEAFAEEVAPSGSRARAIANDEIAPILQDSVCNLRDLASRIHPPVLDDFGLAASLRWLCQQVQEAEDRREVALAVTVLDDEVPEILNDVIYRIVQQTLSYLLLTPGSKDIQVALTGNDRIHLSMAFRIDDPHARGNLAGSTQSHLQQVTTYWERAILAGGVYEVSEARDGGFACQATWRNVVGD